MIAAGVAVFVLALLIVTLVTIFAPEPGWSKRRPEVAMPGK